MDRLANEVFALRTEISELRDTIKVLNCTLMQLIGTSNDNVESKYAPPSSFGIAAQESLMQNQYTTPWQTTPTVVLPPSTSAPPAVAATPSLSSPNPPQPQQTAPPTSLFAADIKSDPLLNQLKQPTKRRRNCLVDSSKYNFPLRSQEDLEAMEATLTTDCRDEIVNEMKRLLGSGGMRKNIMNIISPPNMVNYNVDGKHGKQRLRDYNNILSALHNAASDKDSLLFTDFLEEMRRSLKLAKNKYFKSLCIARKRARESTKFVTKREGN